MEKKIIVVSPSDISLGTIPGDVAIMFHGLQKPLGLAEDIQPVLRLSPDEARRLAVALARKADEAEARSALPLQPIQEGPATKQ
ncbi:hypothetical protein [Burkholderia multivorans]|uniref:hypothetical protein n=1 Tax=Burkholderia multivorans TaxID=87883 RepID=UPI00143E7D1C|nr:hypothetical protein [Burkholderia multivorans]QIX17198.1 hypothetical protein FOB32_16430 [Burkholderia multivorans]